jgi:U3 small nucleolar RNA-associated protein 22
MVSIKNSADFVDVCVRGYIFRLRIYHDREIELRKLDALEKATPSTHDLAFALEREMVERPQHAQALRAFGARFPLYGPVVRLALRWISSHMFQPAIPNEAVELLVARCFAASRPHTPPSSIVAGFNRYVRHFYPWESHHICMCDNEYLFRIVSYDC